LEFRGFITKSFLAMEELGLASLHLTNGMSWELAGGFEIGSVLVASVTDAGHLRRPEGEER
jgi:hypothetical protein